MAANTWRISPTPDSIGISSAHVAEARGAQDGAQLGAEQLRLGQAQAHRAQAERRVVALAWVRPVSCLSAPRSRVRMMTGCPRISSATPAVGHELLLLGRQAVAVEEQELAAEQAYTCRAARLHLLEVARQLDVGVQFDRRAVEGLGRRGAQTRQLAPLDLQFRGAQPVLGEHVAVGVDDDRAERAVDDQQVAVADQFARMTQRHHRRHIEAARRGWRCAR
jgi:hypothetical protein